MAGLLLGGASLRTPVILDGVSAGAAALVARAIAPEALAACIAGHRSAEPGHVAALNKLGLRPLVDLDLRLGEGTGALLALPIVQSAARAMHEVATFDSAGVTEKDRLGPELAFQVGFRLFEGAVVGAGGQVLPAAVGDDEHDVGALPRGHRLGRHAQAACSAPPVEMPAKMPSAACSSRVRRRASAEATENRVVSTDSSYSSGTKPSSMLRSP